MTSGALADGFGRVATDLRVSLTDRCNLRCSYCMPAEGLDWLPSEEVLTDDEVVRLITIAVERLGVREVRFTGGEPLLRRGLADIVRRTTALAPRPETSITTNALGLTRTARALAEAGLDRVNVSLDTVRARGLRTPSPAATGSHDVVAGLEAAAEAGPRPGQGQRRAAARRQRRPGARAAAVVHGPRLRAALHRADAAGRPARLEPRGDGHRRRDLRVPAARVFSLEPAEEPRGSAPAELFAVDGGPHTVGVIASVTRPFCGDCDRVRLTADGQVRNCLFAREESDLRGALRGGADDAEIAEPLAGRHDDQASRPRHRRRVVPAAEPADVGHRRLSAACRFPPATATGQNGPMRLFAAIVPPRAVLDEVRAVVTAVRPPAAEPPKRGLRARLRRPRRRSAEPTSRTTSSSVPAVAGMYLPLTGFGNVTLGDSVQLIKALRTEAQTWERPTVHLAGGTALEFPGDESVWAKLDGDLDALNTIGRGVPQVVQRLGFFVDRRAFRAWLPVGTITDTTSAPYLENVVARSSPSVARAGPSSRSR